MYFYITLNINVHSQRISGQFKGFLAFCFDRSVVLIFNASEFFLLTLVIYQKNIFNNMHGEHNQLIELHGPTILRQIVTLSNLLLELM